jgi:hypothetical protein
VLIYLKEKEIKSSKVTYTKSVGYYSYFYLNNMDLIEKELSENLKKTGELEGGLFAEISLMYCGKDYVARKDLYTVKNGIVYSIDSEGSLYATGDCLYHVQRDCHKIGKYDPNDKNQYKSSTFSYSEIKMLLKL